MTAQKHTLGLMVLATAVAAPNALAQPAPPAPSESSPAQPPAPPSAAPNAPPPPPSAAPNTPPPPPSAPPATNEPPPPPSPPVEAAPVDAASTEAAPGADQLKPVVVTAERREESAQNVPTPVTALSGEDLTQTGVSRSSSEVMNYVPNASAVTQGHGRPRWWIRGVGTGQQQLDFSNPIGFYLDDVYISNATGTGFPIFDVDRVEVLRGPQGTLWGKNTTGGAINVISRRPDFQNDGYLKFDYGTYNDKIAEGGFGGPVWKDRVAVRGSFHYEDRGSRFTNAVTGAKEGQFQDAAARLQLLARITNDVDALANVHFRKYNQAGNTWTVSGTGPGGSYYPGYVPDTDRNTVASNTPNSEEIRQTGAFLKLNAHVGKYSLISISGYEDFHETTFSDADYTPLEISRNWAKGHSSQESEELRVESPREDRWNWILGGYYFYENIDRGSTSARLPDVATAAPSGLANWAYTQFNHEARSVAAFASSTYNFTDALSLGAGVRWTLENRRLDFNRLATASDTPASFSNVGLWWQPSSVSSPLSNTFSANPEKTWNNLTYDATPQYKITKDVLTFFRYAHGVKSGGFNTAATTAAALNVVQPEQLDDFELGAKGAFLKNRLTVNVAAFHYYYRNIQVNVVGPLPPTNTPVSYLQNAKKGKVDGAELEFNSLPARNLHVGGSLGLLNTEFTNFHVLFNGPNYSGNSFVRSPHVTALLRADYRIQLPVADGPSVIPAADFRYTSRQDHFTNDQHNPLLQSAPYSILDARISYLTHDEKVEVTAYVNNATNVHYRVHTLPAGQGATGAAVTWNDPTTVGASLTTRWY